MGLFARAAERQKPASRSKSSGTCWVVGDNETVAVSESIHALTELAATKKTVEAQESIHKAVVLRHAKKLHVDAFCQQGVPPETPMSIQNSDGEKVTFVVSDRSGQYDVKPEQMEVLESVLGEDRVSDLLYTETTIGFNRDIMAIDGVSAAIEKALETVMMKLLKNGTLNPEQADELISVNTKTAFKPGTLQRAGIITGRDKVTLSAFLDAMGSSCIRFIKT